MKSYKCSKSILCTLLAVLQCNSSYCTSALTVAVFYVFSPSGSFNTRPMLGINKHFKFRDTPRKLNASMQLIASSETASGTVQSEVSSAYIADLLIIAVFVT